MAEEYINTASAYDIDTLEDWYINSVMPNDTPVWTEEHLEELFNDFYIIPKDTPTTDVTEVVRCKDCKYLEITGCYGECSRGYLGIVRPDCYCCYGERRIDNG